MPKALDRATNSRRLTLYHQGLTDAQIGEAEGVQRCIIRRWRNYRGLPVNAACQRRTSADTEAERVRLYHTGLIDADIAKAQGVATNAIYEWRTLRGLPPHRGPTSTMTPEQDAARTLLYQLGYSDGRIGREQGIRSATVHRWRKRRGLPAHDSAKIIRLRQQRGRDTILERIKRAIGRALPPDIADDAVSDLYEAVLIGAVDLNAIEREARTFGNRVLNSFASKFGPRSLDEGLGEDDGFRMIDMIRDDRSSSWLEEMGATVW